MMLHTMFGCCWDAYYLDFAHCVPMTEDTNFVVGFMLEMIGSMFACALRYNYKGALDLYEAIVRGLLAGLMRSVMGRY